MSGQIKMLVLRIACGLAATNLGFWLLFGKWWWAPYVAVAAILAVMFGLALVIAFFHWVFTGRFEMPDDVGGGF